ncbi:hypothetical protein [Dechloromonas sp. CZR5]|uniref:hypothetical protein n=1 Tax=Dechloromonas sp. CZR5 TaxID=2608630 RepID=UPI00123D863D|nr:hypothetical protein [Dechloromonas sp. CZR5]
MTTDLKRFTTEELSNETLDELISMNDSFQVVAVYDQGSVIEKIEGRIERTGKKCRVFTEYRSATMAGAFLSPTFLLGAGAAVGIAAHNLATFNPDYEIGKNKLAGTVTVKYVK